MKDANKLEIPVFFIMGTADMVTPLALVQAYFDEMEAPHKELILFEESAHFPFFEEPKLFTWRVTEILQKVKKHPF